MLLMYGGLLEMGLRQNDKCAIAQHSNGGDNIC
jgi:hypothetical protein